METLIRLGFALGIFALMITWEVLSPRRTQSQHRQRRWSINLGLAAFNMLVMRVSIGSLAYLSAVNASEQSIGLLNLVAVPEWLAIIITLLFLDMAIYCQHIVSHRWSLLWRLHQVHHTDLVFDTTTAVCFHPLEIVISMGYKVLCITIIGANPWAVLAFEVLLNGAALFNHSNINLPLTVDKVIRTVLVTPDMHRIHHSTDAVEYNSNYGFCLSCWDKVFNTYNAEPKQPHTTMDIGLTPYRDPQALGFIALLLLPFKAVRR
ncbi:MAG: sterol desaturase family protein [Methylococcales bacterium]|nr:sterol desaturase family protein [Methylococcales bacterium]